MTRKQVRQFQKRRAREHDIRRRRNLRRNSGRQGSNIDIRALSAVLKAAWLGL